MQRTWSLSLRAAALALAAPVALAAPQNVCVIVLDDCGPELIGAYDQYFQSIGKPSGTPANTPAIDKLLAAEGLMFTRVRSAPVCSPARAKMLTGRYASRQGIGEATTLLLGQPPTPGLQPSQPLLPEFLRAGLLKYEAVALGKWHLSSPAELLIAPDAPLGVPAGRWFERYAGSLYNLERVPGTHASTAYWSWIKSYSNDLVPGVNPCQLGVPPCENYAMGVPQAYASVNTTDDALSVLPTLNEPWFLWVAYNGIHTPLHRVPNGLPTTTCGTYAPPAKPCYPGPNRSSQSMVRCMLEALDGQIARLVCALDATDTTVILVGDNGSTKASMLAPYPTDSPAKGHVYELGLSVPLIVRSPLIAANRIGQTCDAMVDTVDVFATVCEIGLVDPATTAGTDSVSLLPYFLGPSPPLRDRLYSEIFSPNFVPQPSPGWLPPGYVGIRHDQALCDERFKLIRLAHRVHSGAIIVTEKFYDLVEGGPPDTSTIPPTPTPDWFEDNNLLAAGANMSAQAALAYSTLQAELALNFPSVVQ